MDREGVVDAVNVDDCEANAVDGDEAFGKEVVDEVGGDLEG